MGTCALHSAFTRITATFCVFEDVSWGDQSWNTILSKNTIFSASSQRGFQIKAVDFPKISPLLIVIFRGVLRQFLLCYYFMCVLCHNILRGISTNYRLFSKNKNFFSKGISQCNTILFLINYHVFWGSYSAFSKNQHILFLKTCSTD